MHENRNLFLFLIEINNMHRTRHILRVRSKTQKTAKVRERRRKTPKHGERRRITL